MLASVIESADGTMRRRIKIGNLRERAKYDGLVCKVNVPDL